MWIECIPNFSEGRNPTVISRIADSITSIPRIRLLHSTSDPDHNRSVLTFAGPPDAIASAAIAAATTAIQEIDFARHTGVHPRIGAIDVLPFVPLRSATLEECAALARHVAHQLWDQLSLPAFLYESANRGKPLEAVRKAAFAGAPPDVGEARHPTAGAVAIGARNFLIAWNIHLETADLPVAKAIAALIRNSSGGYPGVKALGLPLESLGRVQVSINTTDFELTPLHIVFNRVQREATARGVKVLGSELIGLIPQRAVDLSASHDLHWFHTEPSRILENALQLD